MDMDHGAVAPLYFRDTTLKLLQLMRISVEDAAKDTASQKFRVKDGDVMRVMSAEEILYVSNHRRAA